MRTYDSIDALWADHAQRNATRQAAAEASALAVQVLRDSDDPIEVFNAFVACYVDPSLRAQLADGGNSDAERVRDVIRSAVGPADG